MALNQDCGSLHPVTELPCSAGLGVLLPKHPGSSSSQGAKASGCCSLWHSAVLAVQVWGIWVPGKCSTHPFLPPPLLGRWNPRWLCIGDGSTLAMPAARQCLHHSPHWLGTALCHSQSQMSVCQQRGGSSPGEDPSTAGSLSALNSLQSRAGCWVWVLPHFRHTQGSLGFGVVVCPRGQHPGWVSGVT